MKKIKLRFAPFMFVLVPLFLLACSVKPAHNSAISSSINPPIHSPAASQMQRALNSSPHTVVNVDFTQADNKRETLHDMWQVANRISPKNGVSVRPGMKVNTVRMVGGINNKVNGKRVPDLTYDLAFYNSKTQSYEYNFTPLKKRIDAILKGGTPIYQLVLDQPPWAFQRGYHFIPNDQKDGIHFREHERVSIYGNSLPPYDLNAYGEFISALITHLVQYYGKETVEQWRLRVGSEIETPDHWYGTEKEFIAYFATTVEAIRNVLPDAKIGLHTRAPDFIYREGKITNYKHEVIRSFANAIIEYCHDNNIRYDFWGVSDYPILTLEHTRHPERKYETLFKPLVTHPKWQPNTVIDLQEFSVVSYIKGSQLISSETAQADTFIVAMSDHFYQHGVSQVFQWGQREPAHEQWRTASLKNMAGKIRYQANIEHSQPVDSSTSIKNKASDNTKESLINTVGAIVAKSKNQHDIDALLYHYDASDIKSKQKRSVTLSMKMLKPSGTTFFYRTKQASPDNKKFQLFMAQPESDMWLKPGSHISKLGNPSRILNEKGMHAWKQFEHPNPAKWSQWQRTKTHSSGGNPTQTAAKQNNENTSFATFELILPAFATEKLEIRFQQPR